MDWKKDDDEAMKNSAGNMGGKQQKSLRQVLEPDTPRYLISKIQVEWEQAIQVIDTK
jgi:hypothetical protein